MCTPQIPIVLVRFLCVQKITWTMAILGSQHGPVLLCERIANGHSVHIDDAACIIWRRPAPLKAASSTITSDKRDNNFRVCSIHTHTTHARSHYYWQPGTRPTTTAKIFYLLVHWTLNCIIRRYCNKTTNTLSHQHLSPSSYSASLSSRTHSNIDTAKNCSQWGRM